jgi:hypothetical protein
MRFPNESLDDYRARKLKIPDPPATVTLEFTGESEVLKPLAYWEGPVRDEATAGSIFHRLSWFHRSLAMSAALTIVTFLLGTGLYLAVYGPPVDPDINVADLATDQQLDDTLTPAEEPSTSEFFTTGNSPSAFDEPNALPSVTKRRPARARILRAAYRPRPVANELLREWLHPQLWVSEFVPTNQFIYVENGVIKTRIEPQAIYKKPLTLPN